jgi:broad specificity phosphatase PhoE
MTVCSLRLPDDLKEEAARQAEALGVSLNQFFVTAVASRVGAQAETARYFLARAARAQPGTAKRLLAMIGTDVDPHPDDVI